MAISNRGIQRNFSISSTEILQRAQSISLLHISTIKNHRSMILAKSRECQPGATVFFGKKLETKNSRFNVRLWYVLRTVYSLIIDQ